MLRYGRELSTVRASLGATGPRMTLETQMSTNVVMPRPDNAFVASWRQLSFFFFGSDNGLTLDRQQAITLTNDDIFYWHICIIQPQWVNWLGVHSWFFIRQKVVILKQKDLYLVAQGIDFKISNISDARTGIVGTRSPRVFITFWEANAGWTTTESVSSKTTPWTSPANLPSLK